MQFIRIEEKRKMPMKNFTKKILTTLLLIAVIITMTSCNKKSQNIIELSWFVMTNDISSDGVTDVMREAAKKEGRTVLYVSHNMNTIRQLCKRCIVLNHGSIIYDGDTEAAINLYMDEKSVSNSVINLEKIPRTTEFINHKITMKRLNVSWLMRFRRVRM